VERGDQSLEHSSLARVCGTSNLFGTDECESFAASGIGSTRRIEPVRAMTSLGIDIGGGSVKAALLRDASLISTGQSNSYSRPDTHTIVRAIQEAIRGFALGFDAVGVCCPGLLDRASRTITLAVNVPGLVGISLDELLKRALGDSTPPPEILSDAAATAFDLYVSRSLTGRLFCLSLGTGVGAAVIDEGRFVLISGETPGHFGQIDVSLDANPPIGPDGGAGSLEAYLGAAALARYGANPVAKLRADDPPIRALVRALRIGHAMCRPAYIALAGGVGIRLGRLLPEIKSAVDANLTTVARAGWTLFAGENDFHAACGAARYAAHKRKEIPYAT
jgi:predicted NBD/HSP70 family sugar kinase